MTTVSNNPLESGPLGTPSAEISRKSIKNPWNRLWQIPLLLAGLAAFGFGLRALVKAIKPVPFNEHIAELENIIATKDYTRAIDRINTLAPYFQAPSQLAKLNQLAGDAQYLFQKAQLAPVRENYQHVFDHYQQASNLGINTDATMNERWGDAALALGNAKLAVEKLEEAIAADPAKLEPHARDLIDAYMADGDTLKARHTFEQMIKQPSLSVKDRAWALCKNIELAINAGGTNSTELQSAVALARKALPSIPERDPSARILLWIGRAEYEQGQLADAKRDLTEARQRFVTHDLDDSRAGLLLAKIAQADNDLTTAAELYQDAATADEGTILWPAARFGRAEVLALTDQPNEEMRSDYHFAIDALQQAAASESEQPSAVGESKIPEMIGIDQVRVSLETEFQHYSTTGKNAEAMTFLALEQDLKDKETPAMAYRLATTKERRGLELLAQATTMPAADIQPRENTAGKGRDLLAQAADDYLRHSKLSTMQDAISANSLWRAAQLYDQSGHTTQSIAAYEKFTVEHLHDARTPEGFLNMGRLYQSIGDLDKAIPLYQRDIKENPKTPAAYTSAVNLARCYMVQGPEQFDKAEKCLLSLVQDNLDLLPTAKEYRDSLFTLGELYFSNHRWADAVLRLEEAVERYPDDPQIPRAMFLLAECYRNSAADIADAIKKNPAIENRDSLTAAREDRLHKASSYFSRVIQALDTDPDQILAGHERPLSPIEEQYLQTSYSGRANCAFELGDYLNAIKRYDQTATRFPQNIMAIESYVQIVNAYRALQQPQQASAAAERAQWILKRIPNEAFTDTTVPTTRQYYEDFFKLGTSLAGGT